MRNSDRGETGNETKVTYLSPGPPKYLFQKKHRQPWLVAKHPLFNRKPGTSFLFRNRNYSQGGKTDRTSIWERKGWRERTKNLETKSFLEKEKTLHLGAEAQGPLQACQSWSREQSRLGAVAPPSSELLLGLLVSHKLPSKSKPYRNTKTHCIVTLNGWFLWYVKHHLNKDVFKTLQKRFKVKFIFFC